MKFRLAQNTKLEILKYILSMLMVMLIGTCIILSQGNSPTEAFQALITGSVGSVSAIGTTIRWATPSIITGIAAVIAFKSGIWNVRCIPRGHHRGIGCGTENHTYTAVSGSCRNRRDAVCVHTGNLKADAECK